MKRTHKLLLAIVAFWLSLNLIQLSLIWEPQSFGRVFWGAWATISLGICLFYVNSYEEEKK